MEVYINVVGVMYLNSVSEEESWDCVFTCDMVILCLNLYTRNTTF